MPIYSRLLLLTSPVFSSHEFCIISLQAIYPDLGNRNISQLTIFLKIVILKSRYLERIMKSSACKITMKYHVFSRCMWSVKLCPVNKTFCSNGFTGQKNMFTLFIMHASTSFSVFGSWPPIPA